MIALPIGITIALAVVMVVLLHMIWKEFEDRPDNFALQVINAVIMPWLLLGSVGVLIVGGGLITLTWGVYSGFQH